jgi:hypothetical protein
VIKPHNPIASPAHPDEDPTGVRALLSSLPEPEPMPEYLVERINASLAAEQVQRTASIPGGAPVTPLLTSSRRRRGRVMLAIAGAAAAVALVAAIGNNMFTMSQPAAISGAATIASTPLVPEARPAGPPEATSGGVAGPTTTPRLIQVRASQTRYTRVGFVTQASTLHGAAFSPLPAMADQSSDTPAATAAGVTQCLSAIGVTGAQTVQADVAFYDGQPALILVATTDGTPMAYAVGRQCSRTGTAVLRPATPLP